VDEILKAASEEFLVDGLTLMEYIDKMMGERITECVALFIGPGGPEPCMFDVSFNHLCASIVTLTLPKCTVPISEFGRDI
jgi:hypothetical protein